MPRTKTTIPVSDLSDLLKPYTSGWVALSEDERHVVSSGTTLEEARERALEHGVPNAVFVKVVPPDQGFVPFA